MGFSHADAEDRDTFVRHQEFKHRIGQMVQGITHIALQKFDIHLRAALQVAFLVQNRHKQRLFVREIRIKRGFGHARLARDHIDTCPFEPLA